MWGQSSKIVVFGLLLLTPAGLGAQERSPDYKERGTKEASRRDGRIGPWGPNGWETQQPESEARRSGHSDRRSDGDDREPRWDADENSDDVWGDWEQDDEDRWVEEDDWGDRHSARNYRDRSHRSDRSESVSGRVRLHLGPLLASINLGDRTLERAIHRCQRQTHRSRNWCRREILRRRAPRTAWTRARWNQVYVQPPRDPYRRQRLSRRELQRTIEPWVLDRIHRHGQRFGLRGNLRGTWEPAYRYGANIEIRLDGVTIARIRDLDGDGWADDVFLRR